MIQPDSTTNAQYLPLHQALIRIASPSQQEWEQLVSHLVERDFEKLDHLAHAHQCSGYLWFISQGLVRNYYITPDGKEYNKSFITAPAFCGSLAEWLTDQPARFSIQALEKTPAIGMPLEWLEQASLPFINRLSQVLAENLALKKEAREAELLLDDATTRYQTFCLEQPDLCRRLPAYHIASYLGITEVALSRIKKKLNRESQS